MLKTPEKPIKESQPKEKTIFSPPVIELPKGGGAIRGIGEKFAANPVTGTSSFNIPIAFSPGRSGFAPELALSYDSGNGNGPFGFGWSLSLPSISRKTDKGLPQYQDREETDTFILSGVEDLVPLYRRNPDGSWMYDREGRFILDQEINGYLVRYYKPRVEGLFAHIERWTRLSDLSDVHWRSITKDNILTLYGRDNNSRIVDPLDAHIFSWLICETRDDKGNAILYQYKSEDGIGVDLRQAREQNRGPLDDKRRRSNRYIKHIYYGNRRPLLDPETNERPFVLTEAQSAAADWMFEVVFDYQDHNPDLPQPKDYEVKDASGKYQWPWLYRQDPFSVYRSGFEVRTTRLCQRVLMFHHFEKEVNIGRNCLVQSTDFTYSYEQNPDNARDPIYTFLATATQTGYQKENGTYHKRSLPSLEFEYSQPKVQDTVRFVEKGMEGLPIGIDNLLYQWIDLHGEGIPGLMTEQGNNWFYKRNLSPIATKQENNREVPTVEFASIERVVARPNVSLSGGQAHLMDLSGDGQPDVVLLNAPIAGLYLHDDQESWQTFRPFSDALTQNMQDPNLKFIDLDGDGNADVFITEENAFVWHASLAEHGFAAARRVTQSLDEEKGPRLVLADSTESIYLADLSGDGLTDLVRIRNGEVCYWPNLGYGHFGSKVSMDNAPQFDNPDQFDQKRLRLADIDGSGTTDIIYLHREGVQIYFNQSGNAWSNAQTLKTLSAIENISAVMPVDLFGNGTACLVWSSPLPGNAGRQMCYLDLMGGEKPHLLKKMVNNLGKETYIQYASSTKFYLQDKQDGKPWITKLPFPVHVVERIITLDHVSRNHFTTRYAYHHGYFDAEEREFRGFGMVEQWDTEQFGIFSHEALSFVSDNHTRGSHVPPIHTKTWFHTGIYLRRNAISDYFAGLLDLIDKGEYFREPGLTDAEAKMLLLSDTLIPEGLTLEEEREACRSLKGTMLRQEIYGQDGSDKESYPYSVTEQNFCIRLLQSKKSNGHGIFFTHPNESITFYYERNPADPRIQHHLVLEVDDYGNVRKDVAISYARRSTLRTITPEGRVELIPNPTFSELHISDQDKQKKVLVTYTENQFTNAIETMNCHLSPLPSEFSTFELTGYLPTGPNNRFQSSDFIINSDNTGALRLIFDREIPFEDTATTGKERRLIERVRTLYRKDDLTGLLPLGVVQTRGLAGESYKLVFTPGLLNQVFQRPLSNSQPENLLPDATSVLGGQGGGAGGYLQSQTLKSDGRFPQSDLDDHWWIPSGRYFFTDNPLDSADTELTTAREHFFLPRRYRNTFGQDTHISYEYDLLLKETRDALNNWVTVEINDYRVLQPSLVSDPNRNQTAIAFDALGMVVGIAVMGKPSSEKVDGDSLNGFVGNLPQSQIAAFHEHLDPQSIAATLLQNATTRILYNLYCFKTSRETFPDDPGKWKPIYAAIVTREIHTSDLSQNEATKFQINFSYSDGFGREIQKKIQAESGPFIEGGDIVEHRWVGSGWTIFNNKGQPICKYEPFFSVNHHFEFGVKVGISPVLFYDALGRVVVTLHPNNTYEKVVFNPWQQTTYDVNDTVAPRNVETGDPRTDPHIHSYVKAYFEKLSSDPNAWQTWYQERIQGALGLQEQKAAEKASVHADTPTTTHFDTLGRSFLTISRNRILLANHPLDGVEKTLVNRIELDIEGNTRLVRDAIKQNGDELGRIIMRYSYDMLGNCIHQASMEAGGKWMLNDVTGQSIRIWDSRGHSFVTQYDVLRRPIEHYVRGTTTASDPRTLNKTVLISKIEYGENRINSEALNLRTRIYRHYDSAGLLTNARLNENNDPIESYDFKGNLRYSTRQFVSDYKSIPDWSYDLEFDSKVFESSNRYDALNRSVQYTVIHNSPERRLYNVIQPVYNLANLLERVDVWLDFGRETKGLLDIATNAPSLVGVANIDYNARGQRLRIDYKNGASTFYDYDPLSFRLKQLRTQRSNITFPEDCPNPPPSGWPGCQLQNLKYTYDPAGNVTYIRDDAQQTIYFRNKRVEPSAEYVYDALYQLIRATGREHIGQNGPVPHSHSDALRIGLQHPSDGNAMSTYLETYVYDAVGNFLSMQHSSGDSAYSGWTRAYRYEENSLIEGNSQGGPIKFNNRLSGIVLNPNSANPVNESYQYDAHGNVVRMPHLGGGQAGPNMHWDYKDELYKTDLGGGGTAFYVYDASGQRTRKVWEKSSTLIEERLYFDGFEIYRKHRGNIINGRIDANTTILERETLHIMDDQQRIAMVETRRLDVSGDDLAAARLIRYQFGNHLGSASLELDEAARVISYEEYSPYGSSTYQAVRSQTEVAKRYRYMAKERDEETGFHYFGARYQAPWLGRWIAPEPRGLQDGVNLYTFVQNHPINRIELDGHGWRDFARGLAKGIVEGAIVGVVVVAAVASAPVTVVAAIGVAGVAATGYSAYRTHEDYKSGRITEAERDEQYGELAGGLLGGAVAGGSNGARGAAKEAVSEGAAMARSFAERLLPEPLPAGPRIPIPETPVKPPAVGIPPSTASGASATGAAAGTGVGGGLAAAMTGKRGGGGKSNSKDDKAKAADTKEEPTSSRSADPKRGSKASAKKATTRPAPAPENYRGRYNAALRAAGKRPLPENWDVHHRIPQKYRGHPEFKDYDFDAPPNLEGVKGNRADENIHQLITNRWKEFDKAHPHATRAQIENFASLIDEQFFNHWWGKGKNK